MKKYFRLTVFFGIMSCILMSGCKNNPVSSQAVGVLSNQNGCKNFAATASINNNACESVLPPGEECVSFQFNSSGLLLLQHINSGFNCCPGTIMADIAIGNSTITIIEEETSEEKCYCQCLYDLDYEIRNLEPGTYTLSISGPLAQFTAVLDLTQPAEDIICIKRAQYPWDW